MPDPRPDDALRRVELRASLLIDRYAALRAEAARLREENALLQARLEAATARAEELERKLAFAGSVASEDPDVRRSARELYREIDELAGTVDEALHLLETRVR